MGMSFKLKKPDGTFVYSENHDSLVKVNYMGFTVESVECCGWLQVSNMDLLASSDYAKHLLALMNDNIIYPTSSWSRIKGEASSFPLYCVITQNQSQARRWLLKHGWVALPNFSNPNTDNTCTPFMYIPKGCKQEMDMEDVSSYLSYTGWKDNFLDRMLTIAKNLGISSQPIES